MTTFRDWNEVYEPLELPINGTTYTIPPVLSAGFEQFLTATDPTSDAKMTDEEFFEAFLGAALEQMRANGAPPSAIRRAAMVALADCQRDRATAEMLWATGGDLQAQAAYREALTPEKEAIEQPAPESKAATK